jgi:hypothetical protein
MGPRTSQEGTPENQETPQRTSAITSSLPVAATLGNGQRIYAYAQGHGAPTQPEQTTTTERNSQTHVGVAPLSATSAHGVLPLHVGVAPRNIEVIPREASKVAVTDPPQEPVTKNGPR